MNTASLHASGLPQVLQDVAVCQARLIGIMLRRGFRDTLRYVNENFSDEIRCRNRNSETVVVVALLLLFVLYKISVLVDKCDLDKRHTKASNKLTW